MEKLVYLLGDSEVPRVPRARTDLRDRLLALATPLARAGARRVRAQVADLDDPLADSVAQFNTGGHIDAKVSLWLDSLDARGEVERALAGAAARCAGYLVTESVPCPRAPVGAADARPVRAPGVCLVTTFDKPAALSDDDFYARWHGSHTPLSLEIHTLSHYVRNSVVRALTKDAPPLRAIVNEAVASLGEIADPLAFYGSEANRKRAVADLLTFVDFRSLSAVLMSEYALTP